MWRENARCFVDNAPLYIRWIPLILLAIHSEAFEGMLPFKSGEPDDDSASKVAEPVELDDDEAQFEAFCNAIIS